MTRRGWLGGVAAAGVCAFLFVGCGKHSDPWPEGDQLRVLASFPPIYCFASNVAGNDAVVLPLLDNAGVHDYHPSPHDAIKLHRAQVFLINGLDLDDGFAGVLANNVGRKVQPVAIGAEAVPEAQRLAAAHDHGDDDHGHGHSHAHAHGQFDPHVWLGITEAVAMVQVIGNTLAAADKSHAKGYEERANAYAEKLGTLHKEGKALFDKVPKENRKIVTLHDSLRYFARDFDITIVDFIQPSAGEGVLPRRLKKIVDTCVKENVRVIVTEPGQMTNTEVDELMKALAAKGVKNAVKVEFDMMESAPAAELRSDPDYYTTKMRENIKTLAEALAQ